MNNEDFLKTYQNKYESLRYFTISNNRLILNYNKPSMIPLLYFKFSSLNQNLYDRIFSLNPNQIFPIIYMFELLYKPTELTPYEEKYIEDYVNSYNELGNAILSNSDESNSNLRDCLGIPIDFSYNSYFTNTYCSQKIHSLIESNIEKSQSGLGPKLVLSNANFGKFREEDNLLDDVSNLGKAGFTTLILISTSIIATCLYIAFFIFK